MTVQAFPPLAHILVVEDDINLLEGIRMMLELEGYQVVTAENGEQALHVLRAAPSAPDLIVSDIQMPGMDGLQLLARVREEIGWVSVPFIFLTARSEKVDVHMGKQLGADDYLTKPFDADDLLVAVKSRIDRHRAMNAAHEGEMSDLKRSILTILNHEFRTPLTFIVAYADMLKEGENGPLSNDDMLLFLRGVNTGAMRLRRLVENFILLVEMETGDAKRAYKARRTTIHGAAGLLCNAETAAFHGKRTHPTSIEAPDDVVFQGDEVYLTSALVQLIDNAAKFSPHNTPIELRAYLDGGCLVFAVTDHGRGIDPQYHEVIWEPFYQINRAIYEDQGTGSGLAIVRAIAHLHGGSVALTSAPGEGSTFRLCIPL